MPAKQWILGLPSSDECAALPIVAKIDHLFDVCCSCNVRTVHGVVERQINSVSKELRPRYRVGFLFSDAGNPVTAGREQH